MVLLVPDDIPEESLASTIEGNVEEMCKLFEGWDPKIQKLLKLCESVQKWRLCIRFGDFDWAHPSGAWLMLGDAVHATLPYLASGYVLSLSLWLIILTTVVREWPSKTVLSSVNAFHDSRIVPILPKPHPSSWMQSDMPWPSSRNVANSEQRWWLKGETFSNTYTTSTMGLSSKRGIARCKWCLRRKGKHWLGETLASHQSFLDMTILQM